MKAAQTEIAFRMWGGKRQGAGRKARMVAGQPHRRVRKRPVLTGRDPIHVVIRVVPAVGRLRRRRAYRAIRRALITVFCRGVIRVVHLSIQRNHIHLLVEAADARCLARGMQGLQISAARHLNAAVSVELGQPRARRGQVFANRYHAELLDTPRRARHALAYVLNNWRRHREDQAGPAQRRAAVDPYSSGICFDGWRDHPTPFAFPRGYEPLVVVPPRCWMLTTGWRRHGAVDLQEVPGPKR